MVRFRALTAPALPIVLSLAFSACGGSGHGALPIPVTPQGDLRAPALAQATLAGPDAKTVISLDIIGTPAVIAIENGTSGAWTALPSGATSFTVSGKPYGVAYVCGSSNPQDMSAYVLEATTTDLTTVPIQCSDYPTAYLTATVDFAANSFCPGKDGYAEYYGIDTSSGQDFACTGSPNTLSQGPFYDGTQDVFAVAQGADYNLMAVHTQEGVTIPGSTTITFSAGDKIGPKVTATLKGTPSGATSTAFNTLFGSFEWWPIVLGPATSSNQKKLKYLTVASGDVGPNESYLTDAYATLTGPGTASSLYAGELSQSPPTTLTFSHAFNATVTPGASPTFLLNYSDYASLTGGTAWYVVTGDWNSTAVETFVTSAYLMSAKSKSYIMPNVTVTGFPSMVAPSGTDYAWWATAVYSPQAYLGILPYGQLELGDCDPLAVPNVRPVSGPNSGNIDCAIAFSTFTVPSSDLGR